jgi:hypothetical protein
MLKRINLACRIVLAFLCFILLTINCYVLYREVSQFYPFKMTFQFQFVMQEVRKVSNLKNTTKRCIYLYATWSNETNIRSHPVSQNERLMSRLLDTS